MAGQSLEQADGATSAQGASGRPAEHASSPSRSSIPRRSASSSRSMSTRCSRRASCGGSTRSISGAWSWARSWRSGWRRRCASRRRHPRSRRPSLRCSSRIARWRDDSDVAEPRAALPTDPHVLARRAAVAAGAAVHRIVPATAIRSIFTSTRSRRRARRACRSSMPSQILPRESLFRHRRTGSLGLFADWFRYRLLFERGGFWADADMVCLKPFDYPGAEVFAWQDEQFINNAVLGLPAGDPLAAMAGGHAASTPIDCFRTTSGASGCASGGDDSCRGIAGAGCGGANSGPMGLTQAARHFGYTDRRCRAGTSIRCPIRTGTPLRKPSRPATTGFDFGKPRRALVEQPARSAAGFDKTRRFPRRLTVRAALRALSAQKPTAEP